MWRQDKIVERKTRLWKRKEEKTRPGKAGRNKTGRNQDRKGQFGTRDVGWDGGGASHLLEAAGRRLATALGPILAPKIASGWIGRPRQDQTRRDKTS